MTLKFTNSVTKKTYSCSVEDLNDSKLFYHFEDFKLDENMDDGQYNYELLDDDDNKVAEGLLQIGDYTNNATQYTTQANGKYKQYNG